MINHNEERKERIRFETTEERKEKATLKKETKEELRSKIHYLIECGMDKVAIAKELRIPVSTVCNMSK